MKESKIELEVGNTEDLVLAEVEKKVRKRNRPDLDKFGQEKSEPGDNSRFLRLSRAAKNLPPIDISDPDQVDERIELYFDFCEENDRKPNIIGMANWLGVSRDTLNSWKRGEYRKATHSDLIEKACMLFEEQWFDYMMNGKVNPASGIFIGKNHFGYKDQQDITIRPDSPYGEQKTAEQIAAEYEVLPD
jgi:hypothetical protein